MTTPNGDRTDSQEDSTVPHRALHADEPTLDVNTVRGLVRRQFPKWASLDVRRTTSLGTTHWIYRLGDHLVIRLPRTAYGAHGLANGARATESLAAHVPLVIPTELVRGTPDETYPFEWSVSQWIPGRAAELALLSRPVEAATAVAEFLIALQHADAGRALNASERGMRAGPLHNRDAQVREAITALSSEIATREATRIWNDAITAEQWHGTPVWTHGDMLPGNVLVQDGAVAAVIDFDGAALGDPACDLMVTWALFSGESRAAFRAAIDREFGPDEHRWRRARGHALAQPLIYIPYYRHSNPAGTRVAFEQLRALIAQWQPETP